MIGGKLRVAEHGQRVGRVGDQLHCPFGIRQGLARVSGAHQYGRVVVQHGGIFRIVMHCHFKVAPRLLKLPTFKFRAAGDIKRNRCTAKVARRFDSRERTAVHLSVMHDLGQKLRVIGFLRLRRRKRKREGRRLAYLRSRYSFDALDFGTGNGVAVVADLVFQILPRLPDLVGIDYIAVFETNSFCTGWDYPQKHQPQPAARDDKHTHSGAF